MTLPYWLIAINMPENIACLKVQKTGYNSGVDDEIAEITSHIDKTRLYPQVFASQYEMWRDGKASEPGGSSVSYGVC